MLWVLIRSSLSGALHTFLDIFRQQDILIKWYSLHALFLDTLADEVSMKYCQVLIQVCCTLKNPEMLDHDLVTYTLSTLSKSDNDTILPCSVY